MVCPSPWVWYAHYQPIFMKPQVSFHISRNLSQLHNIRLLPVTFFKDIVLRVAYHRNTHHTPPGC